MITLAGILNNADCIAPWGWDCPPGHGCPILQTGSLRQRGEQRRRSHCCCVAAPGSTQSQSSICHAGGGASVLCPACPPSLFNHHDGTPARCAVLVGGCAGWSRSSPRSGTQSVSVPSPVGWGSIWCSLQTLPSPFSGGQGRGQNEICFILLLASFLWF